MDQTAESKLNAITGIDGWQEIESNIVTTTDSILPYDDHVFKVEQEVKSPDQVIKLIDDWKKKNGYQDSYFVEVIRLNGSTLRLQFIQRIRRRK